VALADKDRGILMDLTSKNRMSTVIFNMRMSKPQNSPFVIFQTWSEVTNICRAYLHVYWEKPTSFLRTEYPWKTLKNPKAWISGILRGLPPNSVSTLRGSYGRSKGRCLIRVLTLACGILPVDFRIKWLLWNLDMRFDCAGSHKVFVCVLGSFWSAACFL